MWGLVLLQARALAALCEYEDALAMCALLPRHQVRWCSVGVDNIWYLITCASSICNANCLVCIFNATCCESRGAINV